MTRLMAASLLVALSFISVWQEKNRTIPLEITRRINAWYRATGDVDNYARIVRAGWSEAEFEKVLAEGSA